MLDVGILGPRLVRPPGIVQHRLVALEQVEVVRDEVVDVVGLGDHLRGNIVVVPRGAETTIDLTAMVGDAPEFEPDLLQVVEISLAVQLVSGRCDVDESTNQTGLGVGDADRLVRRQEQHGLRPYRVLPNALLVDDQLFVGRDLVDQGVVPQLGQVTVVLDANERRGLERRGGELIALAQFLCREICDVSGKELLHDLEDRGLSGTRVAEDHEELLDAVDVVAVDDRPDAPFELLALGRSIQGGHELLVMVGWTGLHGIWQTNGGVVIAFGNVVGEDHPLVERGLAVREVLHGRHVLVPLPVRDVLHVHRDDIDALRSLERLHEGVDVLVDELAERLDALGPHAGLAVVDRIEGTAFDQEILVSSDLGIRDDLDLGFAYGFRMNANLIHDPSFQSLGMYRSST